MKNQLADSNPAILFTDTDHLEIVTKAVSEIPSVKDVYVIGDRLSSHGSVQDLLEDSGDMSPIGQVDLDTANHVAVMPYSSGTSGLPKGVMITHRNLVANMIQLNVARKLERPMTLIMTLPLYHIYCLTIVTTMAFSSGSCVVVQPKFDPILFLKAIEKHKVNMTHVVPPQVLFFLNHPEVPKYDLSSLEFVMCGAAPLDAALEHRFVEKFRVFKPTFHVCQGYGMTETSPLTHITQYNSLNKSGTIGTLICNMKCKIVDVTTGDELQKNQQGELFLQGPNIMKGYFNNTKETEEVFKDGWFRTGDILYYDDDYYFYVVDRIKELIKVKGYQVAPAELEAVLLSHPAVADCAVIGISHDKFGEVPKAFIVKSRDVDEKEIDTFVSEHLSPHKHLIGGIVFIDKIPKSPSGKILRRLLKK